MRLRGLLGEFFDGNISEADRVVVSGESKETACAVFSRMRAVSHVLRNLTEVGAENHVPIEFNCDLAAIDCHLLEVPLSSLSKVTTMSSTHSVCTAVVLSII